MSNRVKIGQKKGEKNIEGLIYVKPCFKGTIKPSRNHDPFFYQWCSLGVSKTDCELECIDLDFF
jgi:hypothetical protein